MDMALITKSDGTERAVISRGGETDKRQFKL